MNNPVLILITSNPVATSNSRGTEMPSFTCWLYAEHIFVVGWDAVTSRTSSPQHLLLFTAENP